LDEPLVGRAQGGDLDAFSTLTAAHVPRLYRVASLILRDEDAAADAVQDALLAAWRDLPGLRDPSRFDAWLHRLLVRACYRSAGKRRRAAVVEIRVPPEQLPFAPEHEHALVVRDQLERGFRRLSSEQRTVVVLRHYLGLTQSETAEVMGVPVGTVESRQTRAMQALRAALDADERTPLRASEVLR
jgi:RNA polymerase sigma-70 factor (ECF subfamily)